MRSIAWWSVWGLAIAVGIVGLLEISRNHYYVLLAAPLLSGAVAAAIHRMKYEYHHALEHAKWAALSTIFLMAAVGFLYAKAQAFGPFATGTSHKAILGTTFEMSVPEVERILGRHLEQETLGHALHEKAHEWIWEALPLPTHKTNEAYSFLATLFGARSQVTFHFKKRKLCRVELQFLPMRVEEATGVRQRVQAELTQEYKLTEESLREDLSRLRYSKESVEALLVYGPGHDKLTNIRVVLDYLPLDPQAPAPLAVESNVF